MFDIWIDLVRHWFDWVFIGYWVIGSILGFMFGSICSTFHADNHIIVWMIAWPIKLFNLLYSIISGKIACRRYGHIDKDYDRSYSMNSNTIDLYCNRCGKYLKTISIDEADSNTKEWLDAFNEVGNAMFPEGSNIDLRIK